MSRFSSARSASRAISAKDDAPPAPAAIVCTKSSLWAGTQSLRAKTILSLRFAAQFGKLRAECKLHAMAQLAGPGGAAAAAGALL
jgi:hypothetical protein